MAGPKTPPPSLGSDAHDSRRDDRPTPLPGAQDADGKGAPSSPPAPSSSEDAVPSEWQEDSSSSDPESASASQPFEEDGVTNDMSFQALNPSHVHVAGTVPPIWPKGAPPAEDAAREIGSHQDFSTMDDAAVMLELKAGNMAGFDFLLRKYRKPIINFMYRMTRNQAVAEELAQEVFLRVFRSRETYRAEARFSTWLYRIATNLGVNHARDTRHERAASTVYLDESDSETGMTPDVADSAPGAESALLREERMSAIRDYVMALPERQQMALVMHKYEGMDYKEIGEVLKLSESATKSLLFRAYQTLRIKLKDFV